MAKSLLMFLVYVIITTLPLLTLKLYSPDISFLIMVGAEILIAVLAYFFCFRKLSGFSLQIYASRKILYLLSFYIFIVVFLQFIAFFIIQNNYPSPPAHFSVLLVILLVIVAPVYEEFFFRGCLFGGLSLLLKNNIIAGVVTSIIFCAMHTQYSEFYDFLVLFISSLFMVHMRLRTNGLLYPIILHGTMNLAFVIINAQNIYR